MKTKEKIEALYNEHREDPGAKFDEKNFIEGLIKPNGRPIDDSVKGKKYKIGFLEAVQMEFNVCFPNDVFEKKWSLKDFSAYVEERAGKGDTNLKLARDRVEGAKKANIAPFFFLNILLVPPAFFITPPWNLAYLLVPMLLNFKLAKFQRDDINYYKKLAEKIEEAGT